MIVELSLYAFLLAIATFLESRQGTPIARALIYNAWWFYLLQGLLILNFIGLSLRFGLWKQRKYGVLILHYGFAVVLAGALITHIWGMEGMMHIREGDTSSRIMSEDSYLQLSVQRDGKIDTYESPLRYGINGTGGVDATYDINGKPLKVTTVDFCTRCAKMGADKLTVKLEYGGEETQTALEGGKYRYGEPVYINFGGMNIALAFGSAEVQVPFAVMLRDFRLVRYPGSGSPSSYESDITLHRNGRSTDHDIYMNNVVHIGPYRLYQASYDYDEQGTYLTVNRDRWGTVVTYIGYIMLAIGMILSLAHPGSRFRMLLRQLGKTGTVAVMLLLAIPSFGQDAATDEASAGDEAAPPQMMMSRAHEKSMAADYAVKYAVQPELAEKFGALLIQTDRGRIEPIDTYASKILRKMARTNKFIGLNPDQVLLGITTRPMIWSRVSFIRVGNDALLDKMGGGVNGHISFVDVLDDYGDYILGDEVWEVNAKPAAERTKYDKELLKLDEKVNILNGLFSGQMLPIFPLEGDPDHKWYSPGDSLNMFSGRDSLLVANTFGFLVRELENNNIAGAEEVLGWISTYQKAKSGKLEIDHDRIEAEMLYNRLEIFKWCGFAYMGAGILLLLVLVASLLRNNQTLRIVSYILAVVIIAIFLCHTFGIGLRWYVSGRAPWANAYESMVYVGWATALAGLLFIRRSRMTLALAAFFAGVILFVSNLSWMDPEITPLVPVLKSPWLIVHVAVITGSYGFFGMGFLLGLITLVMIMFRTCGNEARVDRQIGELAMINELAITIGLVLMTAGTFLGAVWANESWGRYWGWDPKETWALITMLVYAFIIHARFVPFFRGPYAFSVMSVIGLGSVLMTFFGVNYYLSGLHSYGADSAPPAVNAIFIVYAAVLLIIIFAGLSNRKKLI